MFLQLRRCVQGDAIDFLFSYKWLMPAGGEGRDSVTLLLW